MISLLAFLLGGCSRNEPVRIGFIGGITGQVADLGVAGRNGAMLAVEERNGAGGINGRPVELEIRDDRNDPDIARRAVTELLQSKVEVIVGPMTSVVAMATVPLVNASRSVMISPTVTATALSNQDDNFFRVISATNVYASKSARCQYERFGRRTIAAIYDLDNGAYSESWLHDFRTAFTGQGGRLLTSVPFHSGATDAFAPLARQLLGVKPDAVLIIANAVDAARICQQVRKLDAAKSIFMSEWASTERFVELAGSAAEGVQVAHFLDRSDSSSRYLDFVLRYRRRFGMEPGFAGLAGYDATQVALEALAKRRTGASLKETILGIRTFQGGQQTISFDKTGGAQRKTFISEIHHGRYLPVE